MENSQIKHYREQNGLSVRVFANACSISTSALNGYENGTRVPSADGLRKMAEVLDVPMDILWPGVDDDRKMLTKANVYKLGKLYGTIENYCGKTCAKINSPLSKEQAAMYPLTGFAQAVKVAHEQHAATPLLDAALGKLSVDIDIEQLNELCVDKAGREKITPLDVRGSDLNQKK